VAVVPGAGFAGPIAAIGTLRVAPALAVALRIAFLAVPSACLRSAFCGSHVVRAQALKQCRSGKHLQCEPGGSFHLQHRRSSWQRTEF
jgi:hypothetical protein